MVAISVIENEITYIESMCKSMSPSGELEYFQDKLEILYSQKETLENNVQIGLITPDKYCKNVTAYKKFVEK